MIDVAVIGAGQAGLTMSHALSQRGIAHVVLERHRIAERWRSERWDSLRFQFPNWALRLPDFPYAGDKPDEYAHRDDVVRFIEAYAESIQAPVLTGVTVQRLRRGDEGFVLSCDDGKITAHNVVIATGPYQQTIVPNAANGLGDVFQFTASDYRNPEQLPDGGILVVGAGASGCQIAEELLDSGRRVYLSVGTHRRAPRRYRGQDFIWWINTLGWDDRIASPGAARQPPLVISGAKGGRTVDLREYAAAGMVLAGRFSGARDGVATFAPDLADSLATGDASYAAFMAAADAHLGGMPSDAPPPPTYPEPTGIESLDLRAAGVRTVIWATGYRYDFGWVDLDVFADGEPAHTRGVTAVPGAYFLGLPLLYKTKSSFLSGVGEDAAHLAEQIDIRRKT